MNFLGTVILDPFAHDFMRRALVAAVLVGAVCALLSCYLVLKGWALMGDAISHAVLPGIVLAFAAGLPLAVGAFAAGLVCALATGYLKENSRVKEDTVMGIVFSGMFALGLVLFVKVETDQHLNHILFGNILGVSWRDIGETALIAVPTIAIVLVLRRDLLLYCFDPSHARAIGLPVRLLHLGLLLTRRFGHMLAVAAATAIGSSVLGTILSFHFDVATGPCIIVLQSLVFAAALAFSLRRSHAAVCRGTVPVPRPID
jgi:manganese/iron transport system permease protein